ncbi:MAG TPA: protein kinase [Candidatus Krumholzibacteria bacterium]|nr:protein kinase [Candidatus Krumholzibacteria bacterium]
MTLSSGTRLGPYEILAPLGAGGMGEVYRARDTRLGRDVAIKVLPQHLSTNPEIRARFEREAKTVSGLNHPHICVLHDVGREGDTDFLVMELIEGETLATRLAKGPLPTAEVVTIGAQIADALDRAHNAGVVHRDLKPGNIMLTRGGAKLMDFGLARATGMAGSVPESGVTVGALTQSPTIAQPLTAEGTIIGTFQYMSPEQLEGKETDARSDLWAFGCVLYEMATGKRAFDGKSQASLITSIMGSQPAPISQVAPMTPPVMDRLIQAMLAKDPADRIQSAHDVKLQLQWIAEGGSTAGLPAVPWPGARKVAWVPWAIAVVAVVAAALFAMRGSQGGKSDHPVQAAITPPGGVLFSSSTDNPLPLAISPDGTTIAFCARNGQGPDLLWVRSLAKDDAHLLPGTEDAQGPFFSPDGKSLGFFANGKMKRVEVAGGPVITLVDGVDPRGASWNRAGDILYGSGAYGPVMHVSAAGGPATAVTVLDTTLSEATHRYPSFLPDGKHFLYLCRRAGAGSGNSPTIFVGELGSTHRTAVLDVASNVVYASGHLVYVRGGVLVAQRFNVSSFKVDGSPVPLEDDARMDERFSRGVFAVSTNGVLVCMTGSNHTRTQLRWLDREGRKIADIGEPAEYTYGGSPSISPDGRTSAMPIANPDRGTSDIWLMDLESGRRRKLTVDNLDHAQCVWLPDGKWLAVMTGSEHRNGINIVAIDGTQTRHLIVGLENAEFVWPLSAARDVLLFWPEDTSDSWNGSLFTVPLSGPEEPSLFARVKSDNYFNAQFSGDGRFVVYTSGESGRNEVYVAAFPPSTGGRWQISQGGGRQPRWNRNGRELFYRDSENYIVAVEVSQAAGGLVTGASHRLFQFHGASSPWPYDISPDGTRFLVTVPLDEDLASPVTVITDWTRRADAK